MHLKRRFVTFILPGNYVDVFKIRNIFKRVVVDRYTYISNVQKKIRMLYVRLVKRRDIIR